MILLQILIFSLFIFDSLSTFNESPSPQFLGNDAAQGRAIKISSDEDMIVVGFEDGNTKIFDFQGSQICSMTSSNMTEIIQILWVTDVGPVTLDGAGQAILWSSQCESQIQFSLNDSASKMNYVVGQDFALISFNLEDRIQQYDLNTGDFIQAYDPGQNQTFINLIYASDGSLLLASTSGSMVRIYNCSDASETQSSFQVNSPVQKMTITQSQDSDIFFGAAENNEVYRFNSDGHINILGTFAQSTGIALCPTTKQLVLAEANQKSIGVYLFAGNKQQTLKQIKGYPQDLDCAANYLVAVDDSGYVEIYSYAGFQNWIIGLIAGIAGGLVGLAVTVVVIIKVKASLTASSQATQNVLGKKYLKKSELKSKGQAINQTNLSLQTSMQ